MVSNPPYIPTSHLPGLQPEVGLHEPWLALDGGENGMDHLLHLCEGSASALKSGGFFAFEVISFPPVTSLVCHYIIVSEQKRALNIFLPCIFNVTH